MFAWEFGDLAVPLTYCVTLDKSLDLSGPQFPRLLRGQREGGWQSSKDHFNPIHLHFSGWDLGFRPEPTSNQPQGLSRGNQEARTAASGSSWSLIKAQIISSVPQ